MSFNPSRIRSLANYQRNQIDLDIYARAWDGIGLHPKFGGCDVDGLFSLDGPIELSGGFWERKGHVLLQEHKSTEDAYFGGPRGQQRLLQALVDMGQELDGRIAVLVTWGPLDTAVGQGWRWLRPGWSTNPPRTSPARVCTADVETWPHRQWIRAVQGVVLTSR